MYRILPLVIFTGLCWGSLAPISKLLYAAGGGTLFTAYTLPVSRAVWTLPAFAGLLALTWPKQHRFTARDGLLFATLAVLIGLGLYGVFAVAADLTSAAHISFMMGCAPPATAALEAVAFRTRLDARRWTGIALGAAGVLLLTLTKSHGHASVVGDLLMLGWLGSFAGYALITRLLLQRLPPLFVASAGAAGGALLVSGVGAALGLLRGVENALASPLVAAALIGAIVLGASVAAPFTFALVVRRSNMAVATAGSHYTSIATGTILSVLVLHERWSVVTVAAGALMVTSLALTVAAPKRTAYVEA